MPSSAPWVGWQRLRLSEGVGETCYCSWRLNAFPCLPILFCPPDLRLQLLDVKNNPYLIKALYGLLMLLPQSSAFQLLSHRLQCVPNPELMQTT